MKTFICNFLSVLLIVQPATANSKKGDEEAGKEPKPTYIEKSHDISRSKAELVLNTLLTAELQAIVKNSVSLAELQAPLFNSYNMDNVEFLEELKRLRRGDLGFEDFNQLSDEVLDKYYLSFKQGLQDARHLKDRLIRQQSNIKNLADSFIRMTIDMEQRFKSICTTGVGIDPFSEALPAIDPIMPSYGVYLNIPIGEQDSRMNGGSGISLAKNDEEKAMWAVGYTAAYIVSLKIITGSWVAANVTAAAALAAAMSATIVLAIVAAIIMIITVFQSRSKSVRMVKSAFENYTYRARVEDGRRYFKDFCAQAEAVFSETRSKMKGIAEGSDEVTNSVEKEWPVVLKKMENFFQKQEVYTKVYSDHLNVYNKEFEDLTDEEEALFWKKLLETPEAIAFIEAQDQMGTETLVKAMSFSLIKGFQQALAAEKVILNQESNVLYISDLKKKEKLLRRIRNERNRREYFVKSGNFWEVELEQYKEIAVLYQELDTIVLEEADILVSELVPGVQSLRRDQLNKSKNSWMKKMLQLQMKHPNSEILRYFKANPFEMAG